jgi:hypothetical protein
VVVEYLSIQPNRDTGAGRENVRPFAFSGAR